jgi:hypothetical protein
MRKPKKIAKTIGRTAKFRSWDLLTADKVRLPIYTRGRIAVPEMRHQTI